MSIHRQIPARIAFLALLGTLAAFPLGTSRADEGRLERHRQALRGGQVQQIVVTAEVTAITDDGLVARLERGFNRGSALFSDGDAVRVEYGALTFEARALGRESFRYLRAAEQPLDVDVVCLFENFDAPVTVTVIGLAGGLGRMLREQAPARLRLVKTVAGRE